MNKSIDFNPTLRAIDMLMKTAGVAVTSVATFQVARDTYAHLDEPWLTVLTVGCLVLVEGAFLAAWLALDTRRRAPMPMKFAWAVTLVTIYVALLLIGLKHEEGIAGWAFRLVLAVLIGRSVYEAGVYELLRHRRRAERNIYSVASVRRVARKNARARFVHKLKTDSQEAAYVSELQDAVDRARLDAIFEVALVETESYKNLLLERANAKDLLARAQILARLARQEHTKLPQPEPSTRRQVHLAGPSGLAGCPPEDVA